MDSKAKRKFRNIIRTEPLWGKAGDAMVKILFKNAFSRAGSKIAKHGRYILWAITNFNKVITQLPRYHAKSTYITFLYVMYCILTRRKKFILIVSSTGGQAVKFLMRIKVYLVSRKVVQIYGDLAASKAVVETQNESFDYVSVKGKKRSMVWNFKELYIEPWGIRVMATSIKSANRGLLSVDDRPDLIILDDVEDRNNTNTLQLRTQLIETIFEELIPAGSVDCQYLVNGTICHYGSFILKLQKSENWFTVPFKRATDTIENIKKFNKLLPESFPEEYKFNPHQEYFTKDVKGIDGKHYKKGEKTPEVAIWQEMYNYQHFCDKLEEAESVGVRASFFQENYNIPKTSDTIVFNEFKYIPKYEIRKIVGELCLESKCDFSFSNGKKIINVYSFLGGDLAVSTNNNSDFTSIFIGFTDAFRNVYVLPSYHKKEADPFKIGRYVLDNHTKYNFKSATFDGQNFQKWFKKILKFLIDTEGYKYLKVYQESRSDNKERVISATLSPYINTGRLYFLGEEHLFQNVTNELRKLGFYDHDDDADGLTYLCSNLKFPNLIDFDTLPGLMKNNYRKNWYDDIPIEKRALLA